MSRVAVLRDYLGDGVYASFDGYHVNLAVNHHENHAVALEPQVLDALTRYVERVRQWEARRRAQFEQKPSDFSEGERVRYVPGHAHGDERHPDCEDGTVTSTNDAAVFVRFGARNGSQACTATDLVSLDAGRGPATTGGSLP